jgi:hypothetical protein
MNRICVFCGENMVFHHNKFGAPGYQCPRCGRWECVM